MKYLASLDVKWNKSLTPAGISLAAGKFHAQSAFHKSRKGFISLRSVLKGTTQSLGFLFCSYAVGRSGVELDDLGVYVTKKAEDNEKHQE